MCNGRGAPRSLVKNELRAVSSEEMASFNLEIIVVKDLFSVVAGYPRSSQRQSSLKV